PQRRQYDSKQYGRVDCRDLAESPAGRPAVCQGARPRARQRVHGSPGVARGVGTRRLCPGARSPDRHLLSADGAARLARRQGARTQHHRNTAWGAEKAVHLYDPGTTGRHWQAHGGGQYPGHALLWLPRLVVVADHLPEQAAAARKEVPRHAGLDPGPGVCQGCGAVYHAACPHRLTCGPRRLSQSDVSPRPRSIPAIEEETMPAALKHHWPEYLMEAAGLGLFMLSACVFATLLEHPASPVRQAISAPLQRRILMGLAMGLTAVSIVYSPWGKQSGAHLNPSLTLTFLRLGKVAPWDALLYVVGQFIGGVLGVRCAAMLLGHVLADPTVNYGFCRKVRFLGQNPKIGYQKFNDLQTPELSKKQLCDRTG